MENRGCSYHLGVPFDRDSRQCGGPRHRRRTRSVPVLRSPGAACRACPPTSPLCRLRVPDHENAGTSEHDPRPWLSQMPRQPPEGPATELPVNGD